MLCIVASYHCMQFQGKLMNQTGKNGKTPSFEPYFGLFWPIFGPRNCFSWVLPLLDVRHCCKLSLYVIARKTNEPNLRKWQKTSFGPNFGPFGPNSCRQSFLPKIWLCQSLDIIVSYHHVQYQKKLMIQS